MKLIKKISALALVSVIGTVTLTGCGVSGKNDKTKVKDDYKIKVGYYNCDHMTAAPVAQEAGIYKKMGLDVTTVGNGKVPEAMAAGQMDAGYIGTGGLVAAVSKGAPIIVGANNHLGGSYYIVCSNDIKEPKQLLGQKIAADPENELTWKTYFGPETGLPADNSKYQTVNIDSAKDAYLAMKTGQIKAFVTCDPWGSVAEHEKTGRILAANHYKDEKTGKVYNCCSFALNTNFIKEHPDLAKKLVKAHSEAIKYIYTHPVKSAKIFAKAYNVAPEVALMTIHKKTVLEGRTLTWKIENEYKNDLERYKEYKTVENIPPYEKVVNTEVLDKSGCDNFDKFIKEKVDSVFPVGMNYYDWKEKAEKIDGKIS